MRVCDPTLWIKLYVLTEFIILLLIHNTNLPYFFSIPKTKPNVISKSFYFHLFTIIIYISTFVGNFICIIIFMQLGKDMTTIISLNITHNMNFGKNIDCEFNFWQDPHYTPITHSNLITKLKGIRSLSYICSHSR